jgi:hypothetical protein
MSPSPRLPHSHNGPPNIFLVSQAAMHFSGGLNEHQAAGHYRCWVLVRLQDGRVSREYWPPGEKGREAALRSVASPQYYAPYQVVYDAFTPQIADTILIYLRRVYESGFRHDPESKATPILPTRRY